MASDDTQHEAEKSHRRHRISENVKHHKIDEFQSLDIMVVSESDSGADPIKIKNPRPLPPWVKNWVQEFLITQPLEKRNEKTVELNQNSNALIFYIPNGLDALQKFINQGPPQLKFKVYVENKEQALKQLKALKDRKLTFSIRENGREQEETLMDRIDRIQIRGGAVVMNDELRSWKNDVQKKSWPPRPGPGFRNSSTF